MASISPKNRGEHSKNICELRPASETIPSRELTYPTLGKGTSCSKVTFDGICKFQGGYPPRFVLVFFVSHSQPSAGWLVGNTPHLGWTIVQVLHMNLGLGDIEVGSMGITSFTGE